MCIISAVVRIWPEQLGLVLPRLQALPGVERALNPGDGRLVLILEDVEVEGVFHTAAESLAAIAQWPQVLNTALVYEYSGDDAGPSAPAGVNDYRDWRGGLGQKARSRAGPPGN